MHAYTSYTCKLTHFQRPSKPKFQNLASKQSLSISSKTKSTLQHQNGSLKTNLDSSNYDEIQTLKTQNEEIKTKEITPFPRDDEKQDSKDIDFILEHLVGSGNQSDFGHWIIFLAITLVSLCGNVPVSMHLYAAFEPRHRCFIPNCDNSNTTNMIDVPWINFTSPKNIMNGENTCKAEMLKKDEYFDPCQRYLAYDASSCNSSSFDREKAQKCEKFVYDTLVVEESLTTKFDMVCDLEYQQMSLGAILMVGFMIGSLLGGRLSDKFGRKNAMIVSVVIIVPTVMFAGHSINFWMYAALKLVNTIALPCMWFSSHTLITELFGRSCRQNAIIIKDLLWPLGVLINVFIFYLTRHWITHHYWVGGFCLLTVPALVIIPESPRWLSGNGKCKSAERVFILLARWNRKQLTPKDKELVSSILSKLSVNLDVKEEQSLGF